MRKVIWLTIMGVVLVITGCVNGNKRIGGEYYVDTESRGGPADDSNPGTKGKPWKTIARAVSDKQPCPGPGDTILVRGGIYRETVILTRGGSANQPLVLKGYGKEKPVIDGEGKRDSGIDFPATGSADYVEITGVAITNVRTNGVSVFGRNQVMLRQLDVSGAGERGILVASSSNGVVEKSQIHHCKMNGIIIMTGTRTWTVSDNDIHDNAIDNIYIYDATDVVIGSKQIPKIENVDFIGPDTARLIITNVVMLSFRGIPLRGRNAKTVTGISTNDVSEEDQAMVQGRPNLAQFFPSHSQKDFEAMVQRRPNLALLFPAAPEPKYAGPHYPSPYGKPLPGGAVTLRDGRSWFYLRNNPAWDGKPFSPDGRQFLVETGNAASNELAKAKYVYFAQTFDEAFHCGDIRILNNRISGAGRQGVLVLTHGSGFLIKNNYIQNCGCTGIQIESGVRKVWVEGNVCIANSTSSQSECGIWVDENADVVVQNNIVTENQYGFYLSQSRHVIIRRNLILNNMGQHMDPLKIGSDAVKSQERHTCGIVLNGGRHHHLGDVPGLSSCAVVHNTFYGNGTTNGGWGTISFGWHGAPHPPPISVSNLFLNNVLVENNPKCVLYGFDFPFVMDGNLYHHASGVFSFSTADSLSGKKYSAFITNQNDFARYQQETGKDLHSHIGRAIFADPGKNNFRLNNKSPGIDQGQPLTRTTQAGSGKRLPVENVWCFSAGYKTPDGSIVIPGDDIMVAGKKARVTAVERETSSLVLAEELLWNKDDPVSYAYIGAGPDIGAVESK